VKRIALLLVLAAACRTVAVRDPSLTGAGTPRASIERFLAAGSAQDIQALGAVWGDEKGPVRDHMDRSQVETRLLIMIPCLRHDNATISQPSNGERGRQNFSVELTQGKQTATVLFTAAKGPSDRWYLQDFEIVALQNKGFCSKAGG
jgi:hypothetical protein